MSLEPQAKDSAKDSAKDGMKENLKENTGRMPKQSVSQDFFMRLPNPNTFRRNLLESSKLTLLILRQTHRVKQIRAAKQELIAKIASEMRELKILVQKIDELMPQYSETELKKILPPAEAFPSNQMPEATPVQKAIKPEENQKFKPSVPLSELDKLSKALEEVQRKLQNL